jgi:PTH1 family peptidyl-tRNA hydrolase
MAAVQEQPLLAAAAVTLDTDVWTSPHQKKSKNRKSRRPDPDKLHSLPTLIHQPALTGDMAPRVPLFIVSIGNPGAQYANTYHSAGHSLLSLLQKSGAANPDWTFHASESFMNLSGASIAKRFKKMPAGGRLVVLHDELEREVGWVGTRDGWSSAKGHNGIKSIQERLPRSAVWWRVAIGIGRPVSRRPEDVANYVLGKMSLGGRAKMEGSLGRVVQLLEGIGEGE